MPDLLSALGVLLIAVGVLAVLVGIGGGIENLGRRRSRTYGERPLPSPVPPEGTSEPLRAQIEETARRVLEVIERHPEGVRLVQIGEELGVDWRLLIAPINLLLEQGRIRKEDRLYFPRVR